MEYKGGSIITLVDEHTMDFGYKVITSITKTISVVSKIEGDKLYCKVSICSVNGAPFRHTKDLRPTYEGELADTIQLVDGDDFDIVIDTKLIPKSYLKNIKI